MKRLLPTLVFCLLFSGTALAAVAPAGKMILAAQPFPETEWAEILKTDRTLDYFVDYINESFSLPVNLTLAVRPCKDANAYYDAEKRELLFCLELFEELYAQAEEMGGENKEDVRALYLDAIIFTLYHEFGHAAADVYDLPITGREEDAADQTAAWIILNGVWEDEADGVAAALDAADFFALTGDYETGDAKDARDLPFWDSHSLDVQRYYNIVCWTYGFSPKLTMEMLGEEIGAALDPERRESCEDEYALMDRSLTRLLQPHFKE